MSIFILPTSNLDTSSFGFPHPPAISNSHQFFDIKKFPEPQLFAKHAPVGEFLPLSSPSSLTDVERGKALNSLRRQERVEEYRGAQLLNRPLMVELSFFAEHDGHLLFLPPIRKLCLLKICKSLHTPRCFFGHFQVPFSHIRRTQPSQRPHNTIDHFSAMTVKYDPQTWHHWNHELSNR